jgi:DNA-binding transcriptional ArsR family regulator
MIKKDKQKILETYLPKDISVGMIESIFKGLGHRTRIEIMYFLQNNPESVLSDISEFINSTHQNTSNHINKMIYGGLVLKKQNGNFVLHRLSKRGTRLVKTIKQLFN